MNGNSERWEKSTLHHFWGEISPYDHVVQIYEDKDAFLNLLSGFVHGGIKANECVIVMASETHLRALDTRMRADGLDVFELVLKDQFIPLNAEETLSRFMIHKFPDEILFRHFFSQLLYRGQKHKRKVRAYCELVTVLWLTGLKEATLHLEELWNKLCEKEAFGLFCAYPKAAFVGDGEPAIMNICRAHRKVIEPLGDSGDEIVYRDVDRLLN